MTAATRRLTERDRGRVDGDLYTGDEYYREQGAEVGLARVLYSSGGGSE